MTLFIAFHLYRLKSGLKIGGVLDAIQQNHHQWRDAFVPTGADSRLTCKQMIRMFTPVLSPDGSNRRRAELRVLAFWRDWLVEIAGEFCCLVY